MLDVRLDLSSAGLRCHAPSQYPLALYLLFPWLLAAGGSVNALAHLGRPRGVVEAGGLLLILLLVSVLIVRVLRSGTLIAGPTGVTCRTILRTHRWAWSDLSRFELAEGPVGASGVPRRYLRVHLSSGNVKRLTELNASRHRDPDALSQLVELLESMARGQRPSA